MASESPIGQIHQSDSTVAIRVRKVAKSYPGVQALRGVNFDLETGEIHGLVGANGAGKSTLIRMLSGASTPDVGSIEVHGLPIAFEDPRAQRANGIAAIYQELTIVPEMTALSNAFLGGAPSRWLFTDRRLMERRFVKLANWMGVNICPQDKAGTLSVANQQMLEIMRAILAEHSVIIMDEPTAPLGPFERSRLYELIRRLKESRVSIIFISHDLDEVLQLSDRISVMRDGQLIETRRAETWSKDGLLKAMLGDIQVVPGRKRRQVNRNELLRVDGLALPNRLSGITIQLGVGEVLGIAGLVGAGRTEVLRSIAGLEPLSSGRMAIDGQECSWPQSVRESIQRGIVLAPEDRKRQGLVLSRSALSNLMLADLGSAARGPVIMIQARRAQGTAIARQLGFNPQRLDAEALILSGGNQQKLVLGKWLHRRPRVLLLDEPTRGIDLGAKQEIFKTIQALSDSGMAVILVSSDLEEVVEYSDRVLVMARGKQLAVLDREQATVENILRLIFAVEGQSSPAGVN